MKYRKRRAITAREIQLLVLVGIVSGIVLGTLIGADIQLSRGLLGGGGFFAPWEGARQFLFQHKDPYSGEIQQLAEKLAYGGPAARIARSLRRAEHSEDEGRRREEDAEEGS